MIKVKRIYDAPDGSDGLRILVDRIWPRGMTKQAVALDHWMKEIAPSPALRAWFGHDPDRWAEFCARYARELDGRADAVRLLKELSRDRTVTLLFSANDATHNNAVALKRYLEAPVRSTSGRSAGSQPAKR